jgi:hypothetical protein
VSNSVSFTEDTDGTPKGKAKKAQKNPREKHLSWEEERLAEVIEGGLFPQKWKRLTGDLLKCALETAVKQAPKVDLNDRNAIAVIIRNYTTNNIIVPYDDFFKMLTYAQGRCAVSYPDDFVEARNVLDTKNYPPCLNSLEPMTRLQALTDAVKVASEIDIERPSRVAAACAEFNTIWSVGFAPEHVLAMFEQEQRHHDAVHTFKPWIVPVSRIIRIGRGVVDVFERANPDNRWMIEEEVIDGVKEKLGINLTEMLVLYFLLKNRRIELMKARHVPELTTEQAEATGSNVNPRTGNRATFLSRRGSVWRNVRHPHMLLLSNVLDGDRDWPQISELAKASQFAISRNLGQQPTDPSRFTQGEPST